MSVINTIGRHARGASLELLIGAAIVLLATVLFAAHRYKTETFDSSRDWNSASDELKVRGLRRRRRTRRRAGGLALIAPDDHTSTI